MKGILLTCLCLCVCLLLMTALVSAQHQEGPLTNLAVVKYLQVPLRVLLQAKAFALDLRSPRLSRELRGDGKVELSG